jgi:acrylyl-CoA reductase (NADPH)
MSIFRSWVVRKENQSFTCRMEEMVMDQLPSGEVTIRILYSSINYKDALAFQEGSHVLRAFPMIPGIDLVGHVIQSSVSYLKEGDAVLATGFGLGVSHFGGFSDYARVPAEWVVALPPGFNPREAMVYGTAGLTAALSVHNLMRNGVYPESGPIIVSGATGGVGSLSTAILSKLGYEVTAGTGKSDEHDYLHGLGASSIIGREQMDAGERAMMKEQWAGAVDPVGGSVLSYLLASVRYGGAVALSGMAGGSVLQSSVFPFILRGISLIGIDSVWCPKDLRHHLWERLAGDWKPDLNLLDSMYKEISLEEIPDWTNKLLAGDVRGRIVVRL